MSDLTLYRNSGDIATSISNLFIDEYLAEANDAQIKVYLYLVRMTTANAPTNISDIADKFNHTEKDICRALRYWEKKGLLSLDYDQNGGIVGIRIFEPAPANTLNMPQRMSTSFSPIIVPQPAADALVPAQNTVAVSDNAPIATAPSMPSVTSALKPQYTLEQIRRFKEDEETKQLLFVAESYLKRTLSSNDIRSIIFYLDELHFDTDLIDYLIQYCVDRSKGSFSYMDKVALDWSENDINTVKQAKAYVTRFQAKPQAKSKRNTTSFHQLEQNNYDFGSLEARLLGQK